MRMPWRARSGSRRNRKDATSASGSSASRRAGELGCTSARMRLMMSAARLACSELASKAWRTAGRSSSSSSRRPAARVCARMAVSGWFNSWAMPAAISPSVLKRAIAASRACSCWRRASARERCQAAAPAISKALATAHASQAVQGQASGVNVRVLRIWKGWLAAPSGFCSVIVKPGASSGCLSSSGSAVWSTVRLRLARPGGKSAAGTNWRASSSRLQLDGEINQYRAGSSGKTTGRPNWRARSSASDRPGGAARLPAQAPSAR
ncbi:hypothetical protein G6F35_014127 [Rhizopus arrhizus]|nr:hypothetical protein G6F35_014127 [Rhizopus arrhizus]